jgi:hypothetical protein
MELCIVISSIGRSDRLRGLLESLEKQNDKAFIVGICDQSLDGSVTQIAKDFRDKLDIFVTSSPRGLSLGRNSILRGAPTTVTHFMFPNDTSRLPDTTILELKLRHLDADVVAMSYMNGGTERYRFAASDAALDPTNVWKILEPAMVLSRTALELAGGFDESLGTGSSTPWQSGEGTDLLLKLIGHGLIVNWDPDLRILGVSENHGLTRMEYLAKLRAYGRGFGRVHGKWSYPLHRKLRICVVPWMKIFVPGSGLGILEAASISMGRVEGLFGRTVGNRP